MNKRLIFTIFFQCCKLAFSFIIVLNKSVGLLQYSDICVCAEIFTEPDGTILGL